MKQGHWAGRLTAMAVVGETPSCSCAYPAAATSASPTPCMHTHGILPAVGNALPHRVLTTLLGNNLAQDKTL